MTVQAPEFVYDLKRMREICNADPDYFFSGEFGEVVQNDSPGKDGRFAFKDNGSNILAVGHVDTVVFSELFRWNGTSYIGSGQFDDRLGIYCILDILPQLGIEFDLLITTDEETGGSTARFFRPIKQYNWIFELDRRGEDVVVYDFDEPSWRETLKSAGFDNIDRGTFTDICCMYSFNAKAFNLGISYQNWHQYSCYADLKKLRSQIMLFKNFYDMYKDTHFPHDPAEAAKNRPSTSYSYKGRWKKGRWNQKDRRYDYDDPYDDYSGWSNENGVIVYTKGTSGSATGSSNGLEFLKKKEPKIYEYLALWEPKYVYSRDGKFRFNARTGEKDSEYSTGSPEHWITNIYDSLSWAWSEKIYKERLEYIDWFNEDYRQEVDVLEDAADVWEKKQKKFDMNYIYSVDGERRWFANTGAEDEKWLKEGACKADDPFNLYEVSEAAEAQKEQWIMDMLDNYIDWYDEFVDNRNRPEVSEERGEQESLMDWIERTLEDLDNKIIYNDVNLDADYCCICREEAPEDPYLAYTGYCAACAKLHGISIVDEDEDGNPIESVS